MRKPFDSLIRVEREVLLRAKKNHVTVAYGETELIE